MARSNAVVVFGALAAAALVVAGCVAIFGVLTGASPGEHARSAAQTLFVDPATSRQTAHVKSCGQIGANAEARIYICNVVATNCARFFQVAVYRDSIYGASPVFAPAYALLHPCTPIHT